MKRPKTDHSKGIPEYPEDWEWMNYADYLEAELEETKALLKSRREITDIVETELEELKAVARAVVEQYDEPLNEFEDLYRAIDALAEKVNYDG